MTAAEVDRICQALNDGRAGTYGFADLDLERDPRPDCEFAPCADCPREHCPERV